MPGADPWGERRRRGLGAWGRDHWRLARDSGAYISGRLGTSFLVWLLIGIALALPAGLYLIQINLAVMGEQWQGRPGLTVYFASGVEQTLGVELEQEMAGRGEIESAALVTPQEALQDFQAFAGIEDALALLDENPLPMSLSLVLVEGLEAAELELLAAQLGTRTGVSEVVIERTWLERVEAMNAILGRLGLVLTLLFASGAVLVSSTSVRLAIESRLDELRVMKLVGATDTYIRRPFLYFGLLYGVGGGLLAAMLISLVLLVLETPLAVLFGSYGRVPEIEGFDVGFVVGLLGLGGLLGVGGALLAARQRLARLEVV